MTRKHARPAAILFLCASNACFAPASLAGEMASMASMASMPPMMGDGPFAHLMLDQFEGRFGGPGTPEFRWDGEGWFGTDYNKLWLKSEGFLRQDGRVDEGRHELL